MRADIPDETDGYFGKLGFPIWLGNSPLGYLLPAKSALGGAFGDGAPGFCSDFSAARDRKSRRSGHLDAVLSSWVLDTMTEACFT